MTARSAGNTGALETVDATPVKTEPMTTWSRTTSQNTITDYLEPHLPIEPPSTTDPRAVLGRRMVRTFDTNADEPNRKKRKTERHYGTVATFVPVLPNDPIQEKVWRVLYDDGQGEDLNWTELKPCLLDSTGPIPPPTHAGHITLSPARLSPPPTPPPTGKGKKRCREPTPHPPTPPPLDPTEPQPKRHQPTHSPPASLPGGKGKKRRREPGGEEAQGAPKRERTG